MTGTEKNGSRIQLSPIQVSYLLKLNEHIQIT